MLTGLAQVSHLGWGSLWHSQSSAQEVTQFHQVGQKDIATAIDAQAQKWFVDSVAETDGNMDLLRWAFNAGEQFFSFATNHALSSGRIFHMLSDSFSCAHTARDADTFDVYYHMVQHFKLHLLIFFVLRTTTVSWVQNTASMTVFRVLVPVGIVSTAFDSILCTI